MGLSACRGQHDGLTLLRVGRYASALIVLQPAATAGNAQAQNALAIQYYLGLGTPRDLAAARRWFELAALQGNAAALHLARMRDTLGRIAFGQLVPHRPA